MNYLFDTQALTDYLQDHKIPAFRAKQIQQAIFKEGILDIDKITTLSKDLRDQLSQDFVINDFTLKEKVEGPETTKFLFELADGKIIETVLMYHRHVRPEYEDEIKQRKILRSWTNHDISPETHKLNRITICISSQVGCAVGCIFCVTGKLGFKKNLPRQEILLQILYANQYIQGKFGKKEDGTWNRVRNVVFMGMGEPMLNYDEMVTSIEYMKDQRALGLSKRHITISTSGVADKIKQLVDDKVDVRLALSLHAPNQELRKKLIPMIAKRRDIDELMETIDYYTSSTGNRLFYEYIMIRDMTDTVDIGHITDHNILVEESIMIRDMTDTVDIGHQLGKLLKNRNAHVNLIPYNENPAMPDLDTSEYDQILTFKKTVESHGVTVTVRDTLGRDVQGACGQLGYEVIMKQRIEDMEAENEIADSDK